MEESFGAMSSTSSLPLLVMALSRHHLRQTSPVDFPMVLKKTTEVTLMGKVVDKSRLGIHIAAPTP